MIGGFDETKLQYSFTVARATLVVGVLLSSCGCGLFGSGQQLKQLRTENDRLIAEYRAQRDKLSALQETNAMLEARVGEAEKLLARSGQTLPSSRISRAAPSRSSAAASTGNALPRASGLGASSPPPYIPPSVPSLPASPSSASNGDDVKWRPARKQ